MKAACYERTGTPDVIELRELPDPVPGPGDVLVEVEAATVNPIDTYIRAGVIPQPLKFPAIPGCDVAGTVKAVGGSVTRFRPGDRVWGSNQGCFGRQGTCAQLAAIGEEWLYPVPDGQSSDEAAAGALVSITAHLGLFLHGRLQPGEVVFVNGGSGGVGSVVIQFAKAAGATVITTAGADEKRELCRTLGADHVLDYRAADLDDQLREAAGAHGGIDLWWETRREPTLERSIGFMRKRGRIIVMAGRDARPDFPLGAFYTRDLRLLGFVIFNASPDEQRAAADEINRWTKERRWFPVIGRTFPLAETAAAHRLQEENTLQGAGTLTGKILIKPQR